MIFGWRPKTKDAEAGLHRTSKRTTAEPQRFEDHDSSGRQGAGKKAKGKGKAITNTIDGTYHVGMVNKVCIQPVPPSIIIIGKTIPPHLRADVFTWGVARQDVILIERGAVAQATLGDYFGAYPDELFNAYPKSDVDRQVTGRQIARALADKNRSFVYNIETGANNEVGMTLDVRDKTYRIIQEGGSELLRGLWNRTKNSGIMHGSVSMQGYDADDMQENGQWVRAVELPVSKELVAGSNLFPFVKQQGHWSSLHCIAANTRTQQTLEPVPSLTVHHRSHPVCYRRPPELWVQAGKGQGRNRRPRSGGSRLGDVSQRRDIQGAQEGVGVRP